MFEVYILQNDVCTATTGDEISPASFSLRAVIEGDTLEMNWHLSTALRACNKPEDIFSLFAAGGDKASAVSLPHDKVISQTLDQGFHLLGT